MRIGMILDKTFPPDSRVENEAVSLISEGHEVYLFCLHYGNSKPSEDINGIKVVRYKSNKLEYKLSALAYTFSAYHKLMKPKITDFIRSNKIEWLHIHDMAIAEAVFSANKKFSLPVTLDLHENRPEIMKHYGHVKSWKGKLLISPEKWAIAQKSLINRADKVIVVTEEAKNKIMLEVDINEGNIVVVPNTVHQEIYNRYDLEQEIINEYKGNFTVLYLGDTGLRRGTDTAIKAVSSLSDEIPNLKLVLVGENKAEDRHLHDLVQEFKCEAFVDFKGWQDVSLFPSYVLAADVCISPLKRNPHHDTTYANKLFQYMALGKPVIVSDSTAQAKVVKSTSSGLIHKAENINDLAEKLAFIYNNKTTAEKMGSNGKHAIEEKWNWLTTSKGLIDLYSH